MKQFLLNKRKQFTTVFVATALLGIGLTTPIHTEAASQVKQYQLSPGIDYQKINYTGNPVSGGVDVMEIDASDVFTDVQLGKADPMNQLATVRKRANAYHKAENKIMGAINANFYKGSNKRPVHLISEDNRLVYAGYVNKSENKFVNKPIAFGMDKEGKGLIDHYNLALTYSHNGKQHNITHTNRERKKNNTILYTKDFYNENTNTNQYGTEVVLKGPKNPELTLGSTLELKVDSIRKPGDKEKTPIDNDSMVLSGHNKASDRLNKMNVGDTVTINVEMDKKWQGSEFMLAGGPQLVKNGKVDISMNTDAWVAQTQTSRTAVGIDQKRGKVFFVTADTSLNNGMSIPDLAKLMKDLGADAALNLDGGGSTTMAIRPNGKGDLKVMNKLQDGSERGISGILMAADTEPKRVFKDVSYRADLAESIHWANENGMIQGYRNNTFRPNNELTRMHGAVMFTRALDLDLQGAANGDDIFQDVSSSHEYATQIAAVAQADIFRGKENRFTPNGTLTRQQMASTIVKAFKLKSDDANHVDVNMEGVDPVHQEYVQILADNGVTKELDDFRPSEAVTRGQFAAFLERATKIK